MMTRSGEKQCRLLAVTMEELIPQDHFLRELDAAISFDFVYEIVSPLYSAQGRPSIDPVILVKMLLLGYLYGIDSERKLAEEVRYNKNKESGNPRIFKGFRFSCYYRVNSSVFRAIKN